MSRPITIFSGQWADLPLDTLCGKMAAFGYDGIELACWGDHCDINRALSEDGYVRRQRDILEKHGLKCWAISNHLVGQAVCDRIDERHKGILSGEIWGDGKEDGVRRRAAENMKNAARAAALFAVPVVNGFTGSPIWPFLYSFPMNPPDMVEKGYAFFAEMWNPILDVFGQEGIRFALEAHPTEIAYDIVSAERAIQALGGRKEFGFNYDPSHLGYQGVDYIGFICKFGDRIYHSHMKDVYWSPRPTEAGVFGGHTEFGDRRRFWDFRSPGRGCIDFEAIIRAFNDIHYFGPLSVEWEDTSMEREHGAREACQFLRRLDFPTSHQAFDSAFAEGQAK